MRYSLVIFDMDGTLTVELIDFPAIRSEIGVPAGGGILEYIAALAPADQARAQIILHRHEMAAAQSCRLHEGAVETLAALRGLGVKTAILTRNSPECARTVLGRHGLASGWDHISTRDDLPHKPHADSILRITHKLEVPIRHTLMVGDYLYDVQAARNAGCDSALLCEAGELPAFADIATYRIGGLMELLTIVQDGEKCENQ